MILYVAGPYRGDVDTNIKAAKEVSVKLFQAGHFAICPHLNTAHFEHEKDLDHDIILAGDLQAVARCDGIVMLPGWENSEGACIEHDFAEKRDIPVWYWPDYPASPPYPELFRPQQTRAFMDEIMAMYRLYLKKNSDYSSAAFQVTGIDGPLTRIWEKIVRMMNLKGYNFEVKRAWKTPAQEPLNESDKEAWHDISNIALICLLVEEEVWGT